jgi:predicted GIY-YIG superfamily endonuclease
MHADNYHVYILTNERKTVLYVGSTNNLERRIEEHEKGKRYHFARRYDTSRLVYTEAFPDRASAVGREKQLKRWRRSEKEALITKLNPTWTDLRKPASQ